MKQIEYVRIWTPEFYNLYLSRVGEPGVEALYLRGNMCRTQKDLFKEFSAVLQFPYYFAFNWDSFDECLNDLEWLADSCLILCISNWSQVLVDDTYQSDYLIDILSSAISEFSNKGLSLKIMLQSDEPVVR